MTLNPAQNSSIYAQSNAQTDKHLLEKIIQEDCQKAFAILFHRYYDFLQRTVSPILVCSYLVDEVVSDVFHKIWLHRAKLNLDINIKSYLKVAAHNRAIDFLRKQNKYKHIQKMDDVLKQLDGAHSSYNLLEELIAEDLNKRIDQAIAQLPDKARTIFKLSRLDGLKYREIADKLNISQKTVETQMTRCLVTLRNKILVH